MDKQLCKTLFWGTVVWIGFTLMLGAAGASDMGADLGRCIKLGLVGLGAMAIGVWQQRKEQT